MMTTATDSDAFVEDEWYVVRYSGEIPEVAFHSAMYYLTRDEEGPRIDLSTKQHHYLVDAVKQRYIDIILRDLLPANKLTGGYRGVKRSLINWKRFVLFCRRFQLDETPLRPVVAKTLQDFLEYETTGSRVHTGECLNCTWDELIEYARLLGLERSQLLGAAKERCCSRGV